MSHNAIKTGAYRALFIDALKLYRETAEKDELPTIDHYLMLLNDPAYKFGSLAYGVGHTDFFRN